MSLQEKKNKNAERRTSVGESLGVNEFTSDGTNSNEERALETALAAARHLNQVAASGGKPREWTKRKQQTSTSLMKATRILFSNDSSDGEMGEYKAGNSPASNDEKDDVSSASESPPELVSVSNSSSDSYTSTDKSDTEGNTVPPPL